MEWEDKAWGQVRHCFSDESVSLSYLRVRAGTCCSRHLHQERANLFLVISGRLIVESWENGIHHEIPLRAGQSIAVPSLVLHRFRVCESGEVVEVYWADRGGMVRLNDIERLDEGGLDAAATIPYWMSLLNYSSPRSEAHTDYPGVWRRVGDYQGG